MAVKDVIIMGHPTLREVAKEVDEAEFGTKKLNQLIADLVDTMVAEEGVGIAAPQINISKQVCIIELPDDSPRYDTKDQTHQRFIIINPKITLLDSSLGDGLWEACLSVPGLRGLVRRPKKIQVDYKNENGDAESLIVDEFLAIVFQHEIDHLFGTLYVDKLVSSKHLAFESAL